MKNKQKIGGVRIGGKMEIFEGKRKCLFCNKILVGNQRKYCSEQHDQKWNYRNNEKCRKRVQSKSFEYYNSHKDKCNKYNVNYIRERMKEPEYKKRYNDLMRPIMRERMRKLTKEWKEKGLCVRCGRARDEIYKSCRRCLEAKRKNDIKRKNKNGN